jgi:hypothetical protein
MQDVLQKGQGTKHTHNKQISTYTFPTVVRLSTTARSTHPFTPPTYCQVVETETIKHMNLVYRDGKLQPLFMLSEF